MGLLPGIRQFPVLVRAVFGLLLSLLIVANAETSCVEETVAPCETHGEAYCVLEGHWFGIVARHAPRIESDIEHAFRVVLSAGVLVTHPVEGANSSPTKAFATSRPRLPQALIRSVVMLT